MERYLFTLLLLIHAGIHAMGFLKAFRLSALHQLAAAISKPEGLFWFLSSMLFAITAVAVLLQEVRWYVPAAVGVICSQVLIFMHWRSAKAGTVFNVIILIVAVQAYLQWQFLELLFQVKAN